MGVNSLILRPILEGPRGHNPYCWRTDLVEAAVWRNRRRRSLPIRPYLHARITRITSVEQLPHIIIIIIINYDNYHYQNQATEWRSARNFPPAEGRVNGGGARGR